jgi:acyl-CoA synthetase (AMP-forming)/AMP-acid ligase II
MARTCTAGTLMELLANRSGRGRGRYLSYDTGSGSYRELTIPQLEEASRDLSGGMRLLREAVGDGGTGEHVLQVHADPLAFIVGFFGAIRAGLVPVPAPSRPLQHRGHLQRLRSIMASAAPVAILADRDHAAALAPALGRPVLSIEDLAQRHSPHAAEVVPSSTAYVQYTSGSVADPKPVRLRHENVLAQLDQAAGVFDETPDSVAVTWVPLYHDMGLVTGVLRPLWSDYLSVLLDPFDFVREPALWPRLMSEWSATHTSAPDFGYSLCARKTTSAQGLDLRSLKVARSAGEPVRARTMRSVAERFRPAGFDIASFNPSYGLAEATLTVTACPLARPPTSVWLSNERLRRGEVRLAASGTGRTEYVSCGYPLPETRVEILQPESGELLGPDQLGEVWISGPQVVPAGSGAYRVNGLPGHRTGDVGFIHKGELYLIGRGAERFQAGGENFYSTEVEAVASRADVRLRPGRAAVFLARAKSWRESAAVVVAECRDGDRLDAASGARITEAVIAEVGRGLGLAVRCVALVRAGAVPVTTSGKVRREHCRVAFEDDALETLYRHEKPER